VVEGLFRHEDNVGGPPGPLPAGSVQRMTLGRGAYHSEQNASETEPMRFIQIWIMPAERGLPPGVEQKVFTTEDRTDTLLKAISGDDGEAVLVHQDAHVFVSRMSAGRSVEHPLAPGRGAYLYVIEGDVGVNGERMETGSAAQISDEERAEIAASSTSELILVDVALG
jgi:redox-sensitive bicupin YhaK (pirin superfamily)